MGGEVYQKLGAVKPYPDTSDAGRQAVTTQETDRLVFKVPSLRNIDKTAPYFHTGKVATLEQAVKEMAEYQSAGSRRREIPQALRSHTAPRT